jgi:hypothetical protein
MYIIPIIWDFAGATGEYFKSCQYEKGNENEYRDSKNTPDWIYDHFATENSVFRRMMYGRFEGWSVDIPRAKFEHFYLYLTGSAEWYYRMIHKFNSESKYCGECTEACVANFPGNVNDCVDTLLLFPGLFGVEGARKLKLRACFPGWLKQFNGEGAGKEQLFLEKCEAFIEDIHERAFTSARNDPVDKLENLKLSEASDEDSAFSLLIKDVYGICASK